MSREILKAKKRWLGRYGGTGTIISRLKERLEILDQKITGVRSPQLTGIPRGGTPITTADLIADKCELEERIKRLEAKRDSIRHEILETIDNLSNEKLSKILECWFIDCLSADDIADQLSYSTRYVWTLYSRAIKEIEIPSLSIKSDSK